MIEASQLQYWAVFAGTAGGLLSVGAFFPQAVRIARRRSAADVSLSMYVAIVLASLLWMFYAWVHEARELFLTNLLIALIAIAIIALRIRFGSRRV